MFVRREGWRSKIFQCAPFVGTVPWTVISKEGNRSSDMRPGEVIETEWRGVKSKIILEYRDLSDRRLAICDDHESSSVEYGHRCLTRINFNWVFFA